MPLQANANSNNPTVPNQETQEDSLRSSQSNEEYYYDDEEMLDEGSSYVFDTPTLEEEMMDEELQSGEEESPVSFNVFYYLLEKFKFSNTSKTSE